jgi:pSer/pThr/pTyr-binding forkhead associated (FHA) protein
MSDSAPPFSDADLEALLASASTAPMTAPHPPASDSLGQRLQTVTEILSRLESLPSEPSLISAGDAGDVRATPIGDSLIVGRSSKCGLVCRVDSGLSKRHFEVLRQGEECFLRDLDSTNGTQSNERLCSPGEVRPLLDGDIIFAGDCNFVFLAGMRATASDESA